MLQAMGQIKLGVSWYKKYSRKLYEELNLVGNVWFSLLSWVWSLGERTSKKEGQGGGQQTKDSCEELHLGNGLNDHVSIKCSTFPPAPPPYLLFTWKTLPPMKTLLSLHFPCWWTFHMNLKRMHSLLWLGRAELSIGWSHVTVLFKSARLLLTFLID